MSTSGGFFLWYFLIPFPVFPVVVVVLAPVNFIFTFSRCLVSVPSFVLRTMEEFRATIHTKTAATVATAELLQAGSALLFSPMDFEIHSGWR